MLNKAYVRDVLKLVKQGLCKGRFKACSRKGGCLAKHGFYFELNLFILMYQNPILTSVSQKLFIYFTDLEFQKILKKIAKSATIISVRTLVRFENQLGVFIENWV